MSGARCQMVSVSSIQIHGPSESTIRASLLLLGSAKYPHTREAWSEGYFSFPPNLSSTPCTPFTGRNEISTSANRPDFIFYRREYALEAALFMPHSLESDP